MFGTQLYMLVLKLVDKQSSLKVFLIRQVPVKLKKDLTNMMSSKANSYDDKNVPTNVLLLLSFKLFGYLGIAN
jgi:hypothetical protein